MYRLSSLRNHPATWLLIPALLLVLLYSLTEARISDVQGYWVGAVSSATVYAVFSCCLGALAAAIDGSQLSRARTFELGATRSAIAISLDRLWPTLTMSLIIQLFGFLLGSVGSWGSPGRFPWEVVIAWLSMIIFHICLGFLIGLVLPAVASAPLALIASFVWLGFTWSVDYVPLRYLSGLAISGCCVVFAELPLEAATSLIAFNSLAVIAALSVLHGLNRQRTKRPAMYIAAPIALVVAGTVLGLNIASPLGSYPSPPRSKAELVCESQQGTDICFYPEQIWGPSPTPTEIVSDSLRNLRSANIAVPSRVSGSLQDTANDSIAMVYRRDFTKQDVIHSFSSEFGYMRPGLTCDRDRLDPENLDVQSSVIGAMIYYYASGGQSDPFVDEEVVRPLVDSLVAGTAESQENWLTDARLALESCETDFPPLPAP